MRIEKVIIKNFRNFKEIEVDMKQQNVIIGLNDVGKTNFICAMRKALDYKERNLDFLETDFIEKNTNEEIVIIIDINFVEENIDKEIILANIEYLRQDENENILSIKLSKKYGEEMEFKWKLGEEWEEIPLNGLNRTVVDKIFDVTYIKSSLDLDNSFKRYRKKIIQGISNEDLGDQTEINKKIEEMNELIASLPEVKKIGEELNSELNNFVSNFNLRIGSSIGLKGVYNDLDVFMNDAELDDSKNYPTSGDGRRKVVEYAIFKYMITKEEKKIPIIFIEEPENHLHISLQVELSKIMFNMNNIVLSTHSPELLYEISKNTNIIKLEKEGDNLVANTSPILIPDNFEIIKNKYQKSLVNAMFCKKVFLVEGYSEKLFFDFVIEKKVKDLYKKSDMYVLNIIGVDFKPYYDFLKKIGIEIYVRTDNDLKKVNETKAETIGYNRLKKLINNNEVSNTDAKIVVRSQETNENLKKRWECSRKFYKEKEEKISELEKNNLFLAEVDFENDLANIIFEKEEEKENFIFELQKSKWHNLMSGHGEIIFSDDTMRKLFSSDYFKGLQKFIGG